MSESLEVFNFGIGRWDDLCFWLGTHEGQYNIPSIYECGCLDNVFSRDRTY